jgi:mono/diheme cytochrome c family protein
MRWLLVLVLAQAGCGGCGEWDLDLERMLEQPRFTSYEACDVCKQGSIMMMPPAGTVSRSHRLGPPELVTGRAGGNYLPAIPTKIDRGVLARGEDRFDIYCAACHGRLGNAVTQVAAHMKLKMPANLLVAPYDDYPPGRIFATITEGYGLMRSYANDLPLEDRWAVVAYVKALQMSQHVALGDLPAARREEARRWLK